MKTEKNNNSFKELIPVLLILFSLGVVINILFVPVHELGHVFICKLYGGKLVNVNIWGHINCKNLSGLDRKINLFFGGLFSGTFLMLIFLGIYSINSLKNYRNTLILLFCPAILFHFTNAFIEGMLTRLYSQNLSGNLVFILLLSIFFYLLVLIVLLRKGNLKKELHKIDRVFQRFLRR